MRVWRNLAYGVAAWGIAGSAVAAPTLDAVLACMRANIPQTLQIQEIELTAVDADKRERQMRGHLYLHREDGQLRAMLRLSAPADLAGAAYLLREREDTDEMYMFVPALNRVRRLSGAAADDKLWGTDIAYGDVRQLGNAISVSNTRLTGEDTLSGRKMHRLEARTAADAGVAFSSLQIWVDQSSCIALRIDFLSGKTVRKRLSVDPARLRREARYWYADEVVLSDLEAGTQTRLKVLGVKLDSKVSSRLFSPSGFHLGR